MGKGAALKLPEKSVEVESGESVEVMSNKSVEVEGDKSVEVDCDKREKGDTMEKQWFGVEIRKGCAPAIFIGKCFCTLEDLLRDIAEAMPNRRFEIKGNLVTIF